MEKEIIPLKHRLKHMLGIRFERMSHMQNGATVARGYYVFFGFYWFAFCLFRKWPLEWEFRTATGLVFSWKPRPNLDYGDLMWLNNKKYLRTDYIEVGPNAAQV